MTTFTVGGWVCGLCGEQVCNPAHNCALPRVPLGFGKCSTCGLEWRGAEECPACEAERLYAVADQRDQARDWCRKLVAFAKQMPPFLRGTGQYPLGRSKSSLDEAYNALPPELRDAIEEAK